MKLLLLAALSSISGAALASVPDLVGEGPSNISLGSAGTALANDAYGAYYNPAGIAQLRHISMAAAPVLGQASLADFSGIVYDVDGDGRLQDSQGMPDYGPVGTDYRVPTADGVNPYYTNGIEFGLTIPIRRVLALGISGYMPSDALMRVSVANPAIPYYVMFADRNNRFALTPAVALQPVQGLYLGLGMQVMAGIQADVSASTYADVSAFPEDESAKSVSADVTANIDKLDVAITPEIRYNFGLLIDGSVLTKSRDPDKVSRLSRHAFGLTMRGPWQADTKAHVGATVNGQIKFQDETLLLSDLVKEPISLDLSDLIAFYNPPETAIGIRTGIGDVREGNGALDPTPRVMLVADMTYTQWSSFQELTSPYSVVTVDSLEGTSFNLTVGQDYGKPGFKDTWSYRGGLQITAGPMAKYDSIRDLMLKLRLGGQWIPTPVPEQKGLTNYMDNDRAVATAGLGIEAGQLKPFKKVAPLTQGPVSLDIGGQFHYLVPRANHKDADLVQDSDGDGIPEYVMGYPLGGQITSSGYYWVATAGISFQVGEVQTRPAPIRGHGQGPVDFPQPKPEETAPEGAEGEQAGDLALPVNEDGSTAAPEAAEKGRKARKAKKVAEQEAAEGAEGTPTEGEATDKPKEEKSSKKDKKKAAEEGTPAEGVEGAEGAEGAPAEGEAAGTEGAPTDEAAPAKDKKEKKAKKDKKKADEPETSPEGEQAAPTAEDAPAPADDGAKKKEKKEKKPKKDKKKGDDEGSGEPLPESTDEETP